MQPCAMEVSAHDHVLSAFTTEREENFRTSKVVKEGPVQVTSPCEAGW
jgi:hypothetical protein